MGMIGGTVKEVRMGRRGIILAVCLAFFVGVVIVWRFWPTVAVDQEAGQVFRNSVDDFHTATVLLAELRGGRISELDNRSRSYLASVKDISTAVDPKFYARLLKLPESPVHFQTNPRYLGKSLDELKDDDIIILVGSKRHSNLRGIRKDGFPASDLP
jgi:hypothetical protein